MLIASEYCDLKRALTEGARCGACLTQKEWFFFSAI